MSINYAHINNDHARTVSYHLWLRIDRLIRLILATRWDREARQVMKTTLRDVPKEREGIRRAGWMN